jgi:hypothetical protein
MFPDKILIANPRLAQPPSDSQRLIPHLLSNDANRAVLDQRQAIDLWSALHDPDIDFCARHWDSDPGRVAAWICSTPADIHVREWRRLVAAEKH